MQDAEAIRRCSGTRQHQRACVGALGHVARQNAHAAFTNLVQRAQLTLEVLPTARNATAARRQHHPRRRPAHQQLRRAHTKATETARDHVRLLVQHAREAGLSIPQDVCVTGCDNAPIRDVTVPLLTTVDLSIRQLAEEAGRSIYLEVVEGAVRKRAILVKGTLLTGQST